MPLPLLVLAAVMALAAVPAQARQGHPDPIATASLPEEIVGENCYIAREPMIDEAGQVRVEVEWLCD